MEYVWSVYGIYGICVIYDRVRMEYAWNTYGVCMECGWNMDGICMKYVWNVDGIWMESVWNGYGICVICMHRVRMVDVYHRVCEEHVRYMYGICMEMC